MPKAPVVAQAQAERAILVATETKGESRLWTLRESLAELGQLARTAGAEVVEEVYQRQERPTPYYVGSGKLEELKTLLARTGCNIVILDDELTPGQQRNLENALKAKVIDRTALILDIFSRHARTREGKLQVELAQNEYLLPRLAGQWAHLERLGGGIGTRGPGEMQLETDRRLVRDRIHRLRQTLEEVRTHRALYRRRRGRAGISTASLVGYTNAGKSTLFNALTRAGVAVDHRLFSTLDPVTRRIRLPGGNSLLLTDTVGFIQKLPPAVVAAFRATLEELGEADLLLHVVDATHTKAREQAAIVDETLRELGLQDKPQLLVFNKVDVLAAEGVPWTTPSAFADNHHPAVAVSALRGWHLDGLLARIEELLPTTQSAPVPSPDGKHL